MMTKFDSSIQLTNGVSVHRFISLFRGIVRFQLYSAVRWQLPELGSLLQSLGLHSHCIHLTTRSQLTSRFSVLPKFGAGARVRGRSSAGGGGVVGDDVVRVREGRQRGAGRGRGRGRGRRRGQLQRTGLAAQHAARRRAALHLHHQFRARQSDIRNHIILQLHSNCFIFVQFIVPCNTSENA